MLYLEQNLFPKNKESRTISLNFQYMVVFKNPRDASQISHLVVGTGRLYPTQTGETSFQETTCRRGRSTSAVAGRSLRPVEFENRQRRYDLSPHGDRRLHESDLVRSAEEQVRGVVGDGAEKHLR